jgi:ATP-dependent DNA helicase RecG
VALNLDTPVQFLKSVGAGRAKLFASSGIETVRDLIHLFPIRYEDRRHPSRISDLGRSIGVPVLLRGRVVSAHARVSPVKRMRLFEAILEDGSGSVKLIWFNQPYLSEQIHRGDRLAIYGIPRLGQGRTLSIESPDWEKSEAGEDEEGSIVPIYPKIGNIAPKSLRNLIQSTVAALPALEDPLPPEIRQRLDVIPFDEAIRSLHAPPEVDDALLTFRSRAHRRMILQEFFTFQLALRVRRARDEVITKSRAITVNDALREEVRQVLPFRLTGAQKRVLREIAEDLQSAKPMYRLLQGDVGSGKTIVALIAAMIMIRNGYQVALLAPTEILVEQHEQRTRQLLDQSVVMARATGSMTAGERRTLLAGLRTGYIQLVLGTHALLEERVKFEKLGLAIVDEQHRFGVEQRQRLFAKGDVPDILVMTATPIPRSLALAMYGDLDLSVIDELPPKRQAIRTAARTMSEAGRVFDFIEKEISEGAQAYIVFPIIEESEKLNLKPLVAGFDEIRRRFPGRRVAMLHGRMKSDEKEAVMSSFKRGETDILVSTTVIEVGIDVPNASTMLILDADRFGLSQLHQLRGRVGRGERKSWCVLLHSESIPAETRERLEAFAATRDGFAVAEQDLRARGPGEFLGKRQSGSMRFRFGDIVRDYALMDVARDLAIELTAQDLVAAEQVSRQLLGAPVEESVAKD